MSYTYAILFRGYLGHSPDSKRAPSTLKRKIQQKKSKLTGLGLAMMTNRMANGPRDVTVGATTIKEMWTGLYDQYHGVRWGAESIIFRELVSLRQSECEDTDGYIGKFRALYIRLTNMERKLGNWILVHMLFNGLGDEHTS